MTGRIGIDITADVTGLDQGFDHAEKRTREFSGAVEKSSSEISSSSRKAIDALGQIGRDAVSGDFSQIPETLGRAAMSAPELALSIAKVVAPFAVLSAGAAAVGKAFYDAQQETKAMNMALAMTSSYSGQTRGDLLLLADALANNTRLTIAESKDVVTQLAASGRIGEAAFKTSADLVASYSAATGKSAAESTKYVISLFEDPAKAAVRLNETMHFLTAAQLDYIETLGRQGRESEAQIFLADRLNEKLKSAAPELGYLSRAWNAVGKAASDAWAAMMNIGRPDTLEEKIAAAQKDLARMQKNAWYFGPEIEQAKASLAELEKLQNPSKQAARAAAEDAQRQSYDRETKAIRDANSELAKRHLIEEKIQRLKASAPSLSGDELKSNQSAIDALQKQLEGKEKKEKISDYERLTRVIKEKIAVGELDAQQDEKITDSQRLQAKINSDLREGAIKLSAEQKKRIDLLLQEAIAIERRNQTEEMTKRADNILRDYRRINDLTVSRIQREAELNLMMGDQRAIAEALYRAEDEGRLIRERILRDLPESAAQTRALAEAEAELANQKERVSRVAKENYEAQRTFEFGWGKAFRNYEENATSAARTAEIAFSGTTNLMESSIKSFVKTGKLDMKSFGDAVVNMLIDIQLQAAKTKFLAPMMSGAGNWFASLFGSDTSYEANVAGMQQEAANELALLASANGNVFSEAPGLHQYVNTVQTSPKVFSYGRVHAFAKGGIFAEEDPEAVMPLARDGQGRLGVRAQGNNGDRNVTNNISIVVNQDGSGETKADKREAVEFGRKLETAVRSVLMTEMRDGGLLRKAAA